jgi:[acyl-carrier-protein] S-malonyltransferase
MFKLAFVFPGQGSQALKMMDGFATNQIVQDTFAVAKKVLGIDFWEMLHEETAARINNTIYTQPLLLTANYAIYKAWSQEFATKGPDFFAGHSLGEYCALVASGVLDFVDALRLVQKRAQLMQDAVAPGAGAMAAVLGLDDEAVVAACQEVMHSGVGIVEGVNFNAPGQVVIAGETLAVDAAKVVLQAKGARKILPLAVSVPSHCQLMLSAAHALAEEFNQVNFKDALIPIVQNINGLASKDAAILKDGLVKQLYSPVLWSKSVGTLSEHEVTVIVECGPGKVLSGLNKRIYPDAQIFNLNNPADLVALSQVF